MAIDTARTAVEATVRDYFEGWFQGSAERMERALHPTLVKRALLEDGSDVEPPNTTDEMIELTRAGRGTRFSEERRQFTVEIADIYEGIATVVVRSEVYREYLHLGCIDGRWQILHALWAPVGDIE